MRWRSEASILAEAESFTRHAKFKGIIQDVGGPTANMYGYECRVKGLRGACQDKSCIYPEVCPLLGLTHQPHLELLREFFPDSAPPLDFIIRTIVGMEPEAVEARFADFARRFAESSRQTHFLRLLKNHIQKYGAITVEKLYEEPFTTIDSDGLDGVFISDDQIDELITIIQTFQPQPGVQTA